MLSCFQLYFFVVLATADCKRICLVLIDRQHSPPLRLFNNARSTMQSNKLSTSRGRQCGMPRVTGLHSISSSSSSRVVLFQQQHLRQPSRAQWSIQASGGQEEVI